ncbi:hypothetical protein [Lacticigenium naphthae]|uniref:hypothetical protein n=1 Tax=Lacticigenium naphthae TaxID=515351 RepID=UPI000484835C|nr:hypothetical protein [Lacticigenium naphthae]
MSGISRILDSGQYLQPVSVQNRVESGHSIEKMQRSVQNLSDTGQWPVSSNGECQNGMESRHSIEKTQWSVQNQLDTGQWPVSSAGECPERDGIGTLD